MQTYVMLLAHGLASASDKVGVGFTAVTVVTPTAANGMDDTVLPFRMVRQPGFFGLLRLIWDADVIQLAGPCLLPMMIGWVLRKPVVVEHHGYQAVCPNGLLFYEPDKSVCTGHFMARRYHKCLGCGAKTIGWLRSAKDLYLTFPRRWICARAATNISVSNHVKNRVGFVGAKVIYHGIPDPLTRTGEHSRPDAGASSRTPIFAYVGRLVSEKGLDLLLEAAQRLEADHRSFCVRFIGEGPERPRLQAKVNSYGLSSRVTFTGLLEGAALRNALHEVDVVVMPSIWEETAGLSTMEHMMSGRAVIATDIGGLGELIGAAGLKFPLGDVDALTSCMKRVLEEPTLAKELGKKARQQALRLFPEEQMVNEHLAVYRSLVRKPYPPRLSLGQER